MNKLALPQELTACIGLCDVCEVNDATKSRGFGIEFGIIKTTLITFTSFVIGAISMIPAGIGLTEASLIGLLLLFQVDLATASALGIFIRLTTIWYATILGFIGARFLLSIKNKT